MDQHRKGALTLTSHCAWIQNRSIASHRKSFEVILGLLKFNDSMERERLKKTGNRAEVGNRGEKGRGKEKERAFPLAKLTSAH
ncbi:hypothetical protein QQF64_013866 [Cirrhinus molitorella]|uniref:Uncharacterized protein n=1 Tax=Cirrhinus molitorella TaxID=172907 RepID=A0ABR3LU09_9TELE